MSSRATYSMLENRPHTQSSMEISIQFCRFLAFFFCFDFTYFPTGQVGMPVSEHLQCSRLLTGFQFSIGVSRIGEISKIEDITALKGKYINKLFLGSNNIQDISPCGMDPDQLTLKFNDIRDNSVLSGMTYVKYLDLSSCQLENASVLRYMTQLHSLNLSCNKISDIGFVRGLCQLHYLDLSYNSIIDLAVLDSVAVFGVGQAIFARESDL
ncbi:leucine-rich_repeat domain-containing protein [Hexamita inflata]|uniref:Leucine-rich repeat domain-containing protein n=1 Tax=Hexamita inflata TaxID=28002 RepID=A0AA86NN19_9EUKA|nr:leucine-rich repeat domain-containing protein [Hexamita inflata]